MRDSTPLHPDVRSLYGASLRPPSGTVFDRAVATTFSLDFETALAVPVTLALYASESREEVLKSPLALLEGLERNADRVAIFCEAGRIQARPQPQSRLCGLLERIIVEAIAPGGGAFHPKVWLLRYRPLIEGEPVRLRLLILSRNLTRDRSWDLSLCLDGEVRRGLRPANRPLVELIEALPGLATTPMADHVQPLLAALVADLQRTEWECPSPFETVTFAVNGLTRKPWSPRESKRMAVISPFCDANALKLLAERSNEPITLVSRSEELMAIPDAILDTLASVKVMDELAEREDGEGNEDEDEASPLLTGLHAKVFIQEVGWDSVVTVGSGNATTPSLFTARNVEVFATLTSKRSKVGGVEEILGAQAFGSVLRPFVRQELVDLPDTAQRVAEEAIERARRDLAAARLKLQCAPEADAETGKTLWRVSLQPQGALALDGLGAAAAWPVTRGETHKRDVLEALRAGTAVDLGSMAMVDVTRFVGFRLADQHGRAQSLMALGLQIDGLPEHRHRAILQWAIGSREAFIRYLKLLLMDESDPLSAQWRATRGKEAAKGSIAIGNEAILEDMVRALTNGPHRLRALRRLMEQLVAGGAEEREQLAPPEFQTLWLAFRELAAEGVRAGV